MGPQQQIAHYRVVSKLGEGGMGVVYKARDTHLDRFVAIKVLPPEKVADPQRKARFVREAKAVSALNHPNIVHIYDISEDDGHDFIAMEYVPGTTLQQLIERKGLALQEALKYAIQIADALAQAHGAGIVHRDVKPSNLMVGEHGVVKVLDFGLAKLTAASIGDDDPPTQTLKTATTEGTVVGTAPYMSPEQAEGKAVDARSDIFSFGAVLYEMVTRRRAFTGDSTLSVRSAILRDEPRPVAQVVQGVPRELERIVARCLRKDPEQRYQHAGDLKLDLQEVAEAPEGDSVTVAERPAGARRIWRLAAAAGALALPFALWWILRGREAEPVPWKLTRMTNDVGLSASPALSPDGKLLAYSSDRGVDGKLDLYVKQVAGGPPIRLTTDGAQNSMPDFSPDGSRIVFRSNRDGGGIYEIPAFGGEARLLARDGLNPKYSPDGSQVAYWVGEQGVAIAVPGSGVIWVTPVAGGQPHRLASKFTSARYPIWSPDGRRLLFIGYTSAKAFDGAAIDWWTVATNGDDAVRTGLYEKLAVATLRPLEPSNDNGPRPACWSAAENAVTFSITNGATRNLWRVGIPPGGGKPAPLQRLTVGAGNETEPSCSTAGAIAFTNVETRTGLWLWPFDADRGTAGGALEQIGRAPATQLDASLSRNGRYAAFASNQAGGQHNIWLRDLTSGREWSVAGSTFQQRFPVLNASGSRVAFSVYEKEKRVVYVSVPGGAPEKLCEGCLRATDWSSDEKKLLMFGGNPYQVNLLDLASHQQTTLLKHATYHLLYSRFSPDNRWVSFTTRIDANRGRIAIAPVDGPAPVPESAWIMIAESTASDWANWSADGKTLYFPSERDGHSCLWGQRLDPASQRPAGEPFPVLHLHGRVSYQHTGWSVAGGRIALALNEASGSIWMMSRTGAR
jgi:Tol biopolymer transport system component/predicted Ser/Thr protein kinase